jgi:hypothetical protein
MNYKGQIHDMLSIMQQYYIERDEKNVDKIYDVFFHEGIESLLIGTDNGEWFRTVEEIKELFASDWKYWGDLYIDTYDFSIGKNDLYLMVTVKGLLDFKDDHAWDLNIYMIFQVIMDRLVCKVMQFTVPRNIIKPTVIINKSEIEKEKYSLECKELRIYNSKQNDDKSREKEEIQKLLVEELKTTKPYAKNIDLTIEQVMLDGNENSFYFCVSGSFEDGRTGNVLPFRIIGIGENTLGESRIIKQEFSLPFVCNFG